MYTPDVHALSNGGRFLLSKGLQASPWLFQYTYWQTWAWLLQVTSSSHIRVFITKYSVGIEGRSFKQSSCQNTSYLLNTLALFCFNGTFVLLELPNTICKNTLYSQKVKSPVASSPIQMHLAAPSGAKNWFCPGFLVLVILVPLIHQHVHQLLTAYDPHLSFGTLPDPSS